MLRSGTSLPPSAAARIGPHVPRSHPEHWFDCKHADCNNLNLTACLGIIYMVYWYYIMNTKA